VIVRLLLFAAARQAAGRSSDTFEVADNARVVDVLTAASRRFGSAFDDVLATSRVWVNGEPADDTEAGLRANDEVAVLPPVSGGAL
jgi:molybdopterin converting factor small subunit